jgi:hypothetical protein
MQLDIKTAEAEAMIGVISPTASLADWRALGREYGRADAERCAALSEAGMSSEDVNRAQVQRAHERIQNIYGVFGKRAPGLRLREYAKEVRRGPAGQLS